MAKKPGELREYQFLKIDWRGDDEALEDTIEFYTGRGWELVAEGDLSPGDDQYKAVFKKKDCKTKIKPPQDDSIEGARIPAHAKPNRKTVKKYGEKEKDAGEWWF